MSELFYLDFREYVKQKQAGGLFLFMKILCRLGCLIIGLIGLSAFDYVQAPYQMMNPIKKMGVPFVQSEKAGNGEKSTEDNAERDNAGKLSQSVSNIEESVKNIAETNLESSLKNQISEYLSNPKQYYLLAVGNRGDNQNMINTAIYSNPDDTSKIVGTLQYHCAVLIDTSGIQVQKITKNDWIKVELGDKGSGYVKQNEIEITPLRVKSPTNDVIRNRIIENAVKYIGLKFVRYGKSLSKGIDCSNFASQIYGQAGISIKTKPNGIKKQGVKVKESQALPGDIVYYYCNNGGGHVGIYMGDGFIINSAGHAGKKYPEGGVRICRVLYKDRENYEFIRII